MLLTESLLKELIKRKFSYCVMTANNITGRQDVSEDCVMVALMALWNRQNEIKDIDGAAAFLYVVTKNLALNEAVSIGARIRRETGYQESDTMEIDTDYKGVVDLAISEVSMEFKSCNYVNVFKAHLNGLNNYEISLFLGLRYEHVRKIKSMVFSFLRDRKELFLK